MKTSRAERVQEYQILRFKAANGQMFHKSDIKRYMVLKEQFDRQAKLINSNLKPLKSAENQ